MTEQAGIKNQSNLSRAENDKAIPKLSTLLSLAAHVGCPWWSKDVNQTWLRSVAWALVDRVEYRPKHPIGLAMTEITRDTLALAENIAAALEKLSSDHPHWRTIRHFAEQRHVGMVGLSGATAMETIPWWSWILAGAKHNPNDPQGLFDEWDRIARPRGHSDLLDAAVTIATAQLSEIEYAAREAEDNARWQEEMEIHEEQGQPAIDRLVAATTITSVTPERIQAICRRLEARASEGDVDLLLGVNALLDMSTARLNKLVPFLDSLKD